MPETTGTEMKQQEMENQQGVGSTKQDGQGAGSASTAIDLTTWLAQQPPEVQAAFEEHTRGLKGALVAEREQRKALERQVREAAAQLEQGSAARKALEEQAAKLRLMERQSAFYDAAHAAGCTNLRLAFIAATDAGLVREDGSADWETIKSRFPELFGRARSAGDGKVGQGHDTKPAVADMNAFIRRAAGKG